MKNVYQSFAERVAADAARAAKAPGARLQRNQFDFLEGEWTWKRNIPPLDGPIWFSRTGYGISGQRPGGDSAPFLIFEPISEMWVLTMVEPAAFGVLMGLGMRGNAALFTGEMTYMGVKRILRQRWTKQDESHILLHNEENFGDVWVPAGDGAFQRITV